MIKAQIMRTVLLAFMRFMLSDSSVATYFCDFILRVSYNTDNKHIYLHISMQYT